MFTSKLKGDLDLGNHIQPQKNRKHIKWIVCIIMIGAFIALYLLTSNESQKIEDNKYVKIPETISQPKMIDTALKDAGVMASKLNNQTNIENPMDNKMDDKIGINVKPETDKNDVETNMDEDMKNFVVSDDEPWMKVYHKWDKDALLKHDITVENMKTICSKTYWNTLETTVILLQDNKTFIITGDIHDMWIRDSTEQVQQYIPLINKYNWFKVMLKGLALKQAELILYDPYANSWKLNQYCYDATRQTLNLRPNGYIATRDHEIDSGCFFIKLVYQLYKNGLNDILDEPLIKDTIHRLMKMWLIEQHHNEKSNYNVKNPNKIADFTGMVYTSNRPSDDAVQFGYHIPDNIFLHSMLDYVKLFAKIWNDVELYNNAKQLKIDIHNGIMKYGIFKHDKFGQIYCYESNGLGKCKTDLDDANVPSLLSIPYYSNQYNKEIYDNTRKYILSKANSHYFSNERVSGIGSPHTPHQYIWPIGLVSEGLTSNDINDKYRILKILVKNTGGTNFMHESFHIRDSKKFTRAWFAWANSYFSMYGNCLNQFIQENDIQSKIDKYLDRNKVGHLQGSIDASKTILNDDIPIRVIPWIEKCHGNRQLYDKKYRNIPRQKIFDPKINFGR